MENQENSLEQQTINIQTRPLIQILFTIVIIFFFFNFFTVSCQDGQEVVSVKGIQLVTGAQHEIPNMLGETKNKRVPGNIWAIIAFGSAIIGLGAFLIKEKKEAAIGVGAGAIGFCSLLILQVVARNEIIEKANGYPVETHFQFAYWGALIAMGIAGFISYLRMQQPPPT